jgi:hypothetical protein
VSFHSTVAPETKFVPFTVSVNPVAPAAALGGESEDTVGTGLMREAIDSRSASST